MLVDNIAKKIITNSNVLKAVSKPCTQFHFEKLPEMNYADNFVTTIKSRIQEIKPECNDLLKLENGDIVGYVHYSIQTDYQLYKNLLPESWLKVSKTGQNKIKPFLWLETIAIDAEKRFKGLGKEAMKRLYLESINRGCEGRMMCHTAWDSYDFYAKTGWEIIGKESYIERLEEKIFRHTQRIKELASDSSKNQELEFSKNLVKNCNEELEKVEAGVPYQEDTIMFNPTKENIAKLFNSELNKCNVL